MSSSLNQLLGIDEDDPKISAARQDRAQYLTLLRSLTALRRARGVSQADVAASMETTQSVVSALEQAGSDPHFSTVQRYARAVGAQLRIWHSIDGGGGRSVQSFGLRAQAGSSDEFYKRSVSG